MAPYSHLGNNASITAQFRCDFIAHKLSGLDAIIDAHSHEMYSRTVKDRTGREIPIAQAGTKLNAFGQLTIYKDGHMEKKLVEEVPEPETLPFETVIRGNSGCVPADCTSNRNQEMHFLQGGVT